MADTTVALLVQAEIALRAGDREQARGRLAEFRQAWATAALPEWLGRRVEAVSNGLSRA